jgi:hypothetical protein
MKDLAEDLAPPNSLMQSDDSHDDGAAKTNGNSDPSDSENFKIT